MKLIIFDGIDNSGKSWTIKKIFEENRIDKNLKVKHAHFPSDYLCSLPSFKSLVKPENEFNYNVKINFITDLIKEETNIIEESIKENIDVLFIDRFLISSLVYQGESENYCWKIEQDILKLYKEMFAKNNITPDDFYNFIFIHKIQNDAFETNSVKIEFDNMGDKLSHKLNILLYNIDIQEFYDPYFRNLYIFDEPVFYNRTTSFTREELNQLDEERIKKILGVINGKQILETECNISI